MIVLDASAAVLALLNDGDSRRLMASTSTAIPHLADSEVAHSLRSQVLRGRITAEEAGQALGVWARLGVRRFAARGLLCRVWELRHNLSAYDATCVALAEGLDSPLVTADGRLGLAPDLRCAITVIRS